MASIRTTPMLAARVSLHEGASVYIAGGGGIIVVQVRDYAPVFDRHGVLPLLAGGLGRI